MLRSRCDGLRYYVISIVLADSLFHIPTDYESYGAFFSQNPSLGFDTKYRFFFWQYTWFQQKFHRRFCGNLVLWICVLIHSKNKPRFGEYFTCLGYETKTEVVRILVIFQRWPMFNHIIGKLSPEPYEWYGLTGLSWKITKIRFISVLVSHPKQV